MDDEIAHLETNETVRQLLDEGKISGWRLSR
jgi:hypothetical protein